MKSAYCFDGPHDRCAVAGCECFCHEREKIEDELQECIEKREEARERYVVSEFGEERDHAIEEVGRLNGRIAYLKACL